MTCFIIIIIIKDSRCSFIKYAFNAFSVSGSKLLEREKHDQSFLSRNVSFALFSSFLSTSYFVHLFVSHWFLNPLGDMGLIFYLFMFLEHNTISHT